MTGLGQTLSNWKRASLLKGNYTLRRPPFAHKGAGAGGGCGIAMWIQDNDHDNEGEGNSRSH